MFRVKLHVGGKVFETTSFTLSLQIKNDADDEDNDTYTQRFWLTLTLEW